MQYGTLPPIDAIHLQSRVDYYLEAWFQYSMYETKYMAGLSCLEGVYNTGFNGYTIATINDAILLFANSIMQYGFNKYGSTGDFVGSGGVSGMYCIITHGDIWEGYWFHATNSDAIAMNDNTIGNREWTQYGPLIDLYLAGINCIYALYWYLFNSQYSIATILHS